VVCPPGLNRFFGPLFGAYSQRQPLVRLEVIVTQHALDLDLEQIDFMFAAQTDAEREDFELPSSPVICVASPAYLAAHPKLGVPADLRQHVVIGHSSTHDRDVQFEHGPTGKRSAQHLSALLSSTDVDLMANLAVGGAGIATVPALIVHDLLVTNQLVRVLPNHHLGTFTLCLRQRRTRYAPAKVASFREFVRGYVVAR
jgi:DNA-binding transcriptional LysR family regulator